MKRALLVRFDASDQGTFGRLTSGAFSCFMTERPWNNNRSNDSCIPIGIYECRWQRSPKFGWSYEVTKVPGRGRILIHPGNYYWHSQGCLLPAMKLGYLAGKKAGLISKPAVTKLNSYFNKESFILEIQNADLSSNVLF